MLPGYRPPQPPQPENALEGDLAVAVAGEALPLGEARQVLEGRLVVGAAGGEQLEPLALAIADGDPATNPDLDRCSARRRQLIEPEDTDRIPGVAILHGRPEGAIAERRPDNDGARLG